MINALSRLLHTANAGRRQEFYPTKDRILKLFARRDGYDLQLFPCWGCDDCNDQGWGDSWDTCGGSGTHHGFILDRYELGGRIFHRPRPMCRPSNTGRPFMKQYPRYDSPVGAHGERSRIAGKTRGGVERGQIDRLASDRVAGWLMLVVGPNRRKGIRLIGGFQPSRVPTERGYSPACGFDGFIGWADGRDDIPF